MVDDNLDSNSWKEDKTRPERIRSRYTQRWWEITPITPERHINKREKKMCSFFAILTVVILIGVLAYISYIEDVIKKYKLGHNLDSEEKEIIRELKRSNHL